MLDEKLMSDAYAMHKDLQEKFRNTPPEGTVVDCLGKGYLVYPSVFWPHPGSAVLVYNFKINEKESVLDLCTGSGIIAIDAALKGASKVVALDINPKAIMATKNNALFYNVGNIIDARVSDMYDALKEEEKFDVITINPPFTPTPYERGDFVEKCMWDPELHVQKALFEEFSKHLKPNGRIYSLQSNYGSYRTMLKMAKHYNLSAKKIGENVLNNFKFFAFAFKRSTLKSRREELNE